MTHFIALFLAFACGAAAAADVALIGVMRDKAAVLAFDGGEPRTVRVGQKFRNLTVISVERTQATVEIDGKRRVLQIGQHYRAKEAATNRETVTLAADNRGHFFTDGAVNGVFVRFMVDTGATVVVLPSAEASRLGIDYRRGQRGVMQTAAGPADGYVIRLDRIKVGAIELTNVDAVVMEQGLAIALLGMSFLNRVEMKRDGQTMMLIRRF
jgi:aspartyl protease family protein